MRPAFLFHQSVKLNEERIKSSMSRNSEGAFNVEFVNVEFVNVECSIIKNRTTKTVTSKFNIENGSFDKRKKNIYKRPSFLMLPLSPLTLGFWCPCFIEKMIRHSMLPSFTKQNCQQPSKIYINVITLGQGSFYHINWMTKTTHDFYKDIFNKWNKWNVITISDW